MDYRPKYKGRYYKTPEKNIGRTLFDINHSNILIAPPPRIMTVKTKINQWDLSSKAFAQQRKPLKKKMK